MVKIDVDRLSKSVGVAAQRMHDTVCMSCLLVVLVDVLIVVLRERDIAVMRTMTLAVVRLAMMAAELLMLTWVGWRVQIVVRALHTGFFVCCQI